MQKNLCRMSRKKIFNDPELMGEASEKDRFGDCSSVLLPGGLPLQEFIQWRQPVLAVARLDVRWERVVQALWEVYSLFVCKTGNSCFINNIN